MNNRMIKYCFICLSILFVVIIIGFITKNSWIDNIDVNEQIANGKRMNLTVQDEEGDLFVDSYFKNDCCNLEKIEKESDYILEVEINGKRTNFSDSIFSEINVVKSIKNKGDNIDLNNVEICEPNSFMYNELYYSLVGYNIMQEGKKYILFLRQVTPSDINNSIGKIILVPISTLYGKYEVGQENKTKLIDNEKLSYADIEEYEILTSNETVLKNYFELKKEIMQKYELD